MIHFGDLQLPVRASLGTLSTMPELLDHFGYAGPHGGDLDRTTRLAAEEAYMLCSLVGDFKIGTSPRPIMAVRLVLPKAILTQAR